MKFTIYNPFIFDTSVWVALFCKEDNQHKKALDLLEIVEWNNCFIPTILYAEITTVLKLKASDKHLEQFIDFIIRKEISFLEARRDLFHKTSQNILKTKKKFSFEDCLLVELQKEGYRVYTFDEDLRKELDHA